MLARTRDMVEYTGLTDIREISSRITTFRKFTRREMLHLPQNMKDIGQLIRVSLETGIGESRIVDTENGLAEDMHMLTGSKAILEGKVKLRLEYVDDTSFREVHSATFTIPLSTYVVVDKGLRHINNSAAGIHVLDCLLEPINERNLSLNLILFAAIEC